MRLNMELNADKQLIRKVLGNKNRYIIPRYQREYSWEKEEISEYYVDILKQLRFSKEVESDDYFIGSILLTGDYNSSGKELEVVDGQQRLTTITIFLSALAETLSKINESKLSDNVWKYIIAEDDNGEEYPILFNEMQYPYFQYYIQRKNKVKMDPTCEEEDRIKFAFDYFESNLKEENLRRNIRNVILDVDIDNYTYPDLLKAIRDQVLNCYVICIWTTETKYANEIFEILNAKGKQLTSVDLIKNNIFKILKKEVPDDPKIKWKKIKNTLSYENGRIDFSTFFRQYWISKYKKVTYDKLYDNFMSTIEENEESYSKFVNDLYEESKLYMKIVNPKREDYDNRKEYYYLVESLKTVNENFGIKQTRIAYMALFNAKDKGIITNKQFKNVIQIIEDFHFVYNAVCALRANAFESIYSQFAISLNKAEDANQAEKAIEILHTRLKELYPTYEVFEGRFIKLQYSKKAINTNLVSKYVVNRIDKYYSKRETIRDDGSVEHILSEDRDVEYSLNIGNLILLEIGINGDCDNKDFKTKIGLYKKSRFEGVEKFIKDYKDIDIWGQAEIEERAKKLARIVYNNNKNCSTN